MVAIPTRDNNVCKELKGHVVYYAVFVDSKYTGAWSTFDIESTLDSIKVAMCWLEAQAAERGIELDVEIVCHQQDGTVPVKANLTGKDVIGTILRSNPVKQFDRWADKASKQAGRAFGPDTSEITLTKNSMKNAERLIARARDIHRTDDVGLVFMVNNYFSDDASVALHIGHDHHVEYVVQSFKDPSVIAHEFLHLFGALDLYKTPFDKGRKIKKQKEFAMKEFPDEIMAFQYRSLDSLGISELTEYCLGWKNELKKEYQQMLLGKRFTTPKY